MPKIAVILFPGTNCQIEALRAVKRSNMKPELIRWNDESIDYSSYDGFFLPGGFSYEDRGRSGIIASKDPLIEKIKVEANKGKAVIGICNGAQVLIEAKLIPGIHKNHLEMALAHNLRIDSKGNILGTGFYNEWIYIKNTVTPGRCIFNKYNQDHIMKIPIAHGEGRFTTTSSDLIEKLTQNEQTVFKYCDENGEIKNEFPVNPNGATDNLAGICNPEGNVLSLMPHPERTQLGQAIFDSVSDYLNKKFTLVTKEKISEEKDAGAVDKVKNYEKPSIEILVDLIITDNEERTMEHAIHEMGYPKIHLQKQSYYGIITDPDSNLQEIAKKLIESGEIVNLAKEIPTIVLNGDEYYSYDLDKEKLIKKKFKETEGAHYLTFNKDDSVAKDIEQKLIDHFKLNKIKKVLRGRKWSLDTNPNQSNQIVNTHIFHNPHSMDIYQI